MFPRKLEGQELPGEVEAALQEEEGGEEETPTFPEVYDPGGPELEVSVEGVSRADPAVDWSEDEQDVQESAPLVLEVVETRTAKTKKVKGKARASKAKRDHQSVQGIPFCTADTLRTKGCR